MTSLDKYRFGRALRPFSFPVALITCLAGILAAYGEGVWQPINVGLILVAGVLLQAGVNLINNHADLAQLPESADAARSRIIRHFHMGLGCFLLAAVIGFWLILEAGWPLLLICLLGLAGALGYTLEPINFKRRGLGVPLVFWLMGVLMVCGSHLAAGAAFSWHSVWLSLPISCLVSLLLLSNELRDYEADRAEGLRTLTVRIGYGAGVRLYYLLLLASQLLTLLLWWRDLITLPWAMLLVLPVLPAALRLLAASPVQRQGLPPATARILLLFGVGFLFGLPSWI